MWREWHGMRDGAAARGDGDAPPTESEVRQQVAISARYEPTRARDSRSG